jgi:hypothetical protein
MAVKSFITLATDDYEALLLRDVLKVGIFMMDVIRLNVVVPCEHW